MKSVEELKAIQEFGKTLLYRNYEEVKTELENKDYRFRVVRYDDVPMAITCDMRMDRLNLTVNNNVITKITFG